MPTRSSSSQRSSLLRKNIICSLAIKGWSAIVVLLTVPITLKCLGEYVNGVWLTISSLLIWIDNMDIGLGNGLRNKLAICMARNDLARAKSLISSTFAMLFCIMMPIVIILLGLVFLFDSYAFFNVSSEIISNLNLVLAVTIIVVCSTFVLKLIGNFYMGLQLPAISNLLICMSQTLALVGTWMIYISGSHSLLLIALANTVSPLLVYLAAIPYTFLYKYPQLCPSPRHISFQEAKDVINIGVKFFILQISGVVLFMTSNILIANFFSPTMVTPYQIAYRYYSLMLVVFTVICMPYWNATTDAYERRDFEWIKRATHRLNLFTWGIFISMFIMVLLSDIIFSIWIGDEVQIDIKLSITMAIYVFTLIYSMRYSYFINGIGKLRLQLIFTISAAIIFVPLVCLVVKYTNSIICFVIVMCLVNIPGLIINKIQFYKLIKGKATGIWTQ